MSKVSQNGQSWVLIKLGGDIHLYSCLQVVNSKDTKQGIVEYTLLEKILTKKFILRCFSKFNNTNKMLEVFPAVSCTERCKVWDLPCHYNHKVHDIPHVPEVASTVKNKPWNDHILEIRKNWLTDWFMKDLLSLWIKRTEQTH